MNTHVRGLYTGSCQLLAMVSLVTQSQRFVTALNMRFECPISPIRRNVGHPCMLKAQWTCKRRDCEFEKDAGQGQSWIQAKRTSDTEVQYDTVSSRLSINLGLSLKWLWFMAGSLCSSWRIKGRRVSCKHLLPEVMYKNRASQHMILQYSGKRKVLILTISLTE